MSKRLNNFEALRLLAMFMVVTLHYLDKGGLLTSASAEFTLSSYMAWLIESFAIVAVNVYVLITGYFMSESRMKLGRLAEIVCQVLWYSLLIPVVLSLFGMVDLSGLTIYDWLKYIFPVHMEQYWFVTSYVVLMFFVPFLNAGVQQMSRKQLAVMLALFVVYGTLPKSVLPLQFTVDKLGYDAFWMVCVYLIGAYIRRYGIPFFSTMTRSLVCYVAGALSIFISLIVMRVIYFRLDAFGNRLNFAYHYNHIFCLFASVALFYTFAHWKLKEGRLSRLIGRVAPYAFGVYLLHEHDLIRRLWPGWLAVAPTPNPLLLVLELVIKCAIVMAAGLFLDWLRSLVFQGVKKVGGRIGTKKQQMDE